MGEESDVTEYYNKLEKDYDDKFIPEGKEPEVKDLNHGLNNSPKSEEINESN